MLPRILKRTMWGVLALAGVTLAVILFWLASNWFDDAPQPWPEALTPHAIPVAENDDFWSALLAASAKYVGDSRLTLSDCKNNDCSDAWKAESSRWVAMRQAHAALGAACES